MIRLASSEDIPQLLRMGRNFFDVSGYADYMEFNIDDSKELLTTLIDFGTLLTDGKYCMLGFVIFPAFMCNKTLIAQELFWWVDEEKRGSGLANDLLLKAESLAKGNGANIMAMLSLEELNGKKVNSLYLKSGYKRKEQTFMRAL